MFVVVVGNLGRGVFDPPKPSVVMQYYLTASLLWPICDKLIGYLPLLLLTDRVFTYLRDEGEAQSEAFLGRVAKYSSARLLLRSIRSSS
jgi:hypothetical protein